MRITRQARRMKALALAVLVACGASDVPVRPPAEQVRDSATAVAALQASKFEDAHREATTALSRDPRNSRAAAVRAIAAYQRSGSRLIGDIDDLFAGADVMKAFDHKGGRAAWQRWLDELVAVDRDLAIVAADPTFSLELCIACWEHDWNHSGEIDERDRRMFELELDGKGGELAESDPRRRPTYRLDTGDADWARAMISFQRALGELVLAYRWSELDKLLAAGSPEGLTIRLDDKARVQRARELVMTGLGFAERCRAAYLAETDDDREWVPNPRQKSYAMPLEVDTRLYTTWAEVIRDVRRLLASEEGISMVELAGALDDDLVAMAPNAFIDFGRMLREPKDIVIKLEFADRGPDAKSAERVLRGVLGNGYAHRMRASPLVGRLRLMKGELDRGEDTLSRKLRYLIWLN
jgi:hypothetical protein